MKEFDGWRPHAVVFDCDGLLMDSETCWSVAESELFARRGLTFTAEHKSLLIGGPLAGTGRTLAELFDEPNQEGAIEQELVGLVQQVLASSAVPFDGAHELVDAVRRKVPVAIASNSPRFLLDATLIRGRFDFDITIAADEVAVPKPAPDIYLEACRRLSADPTSALAFEDSRTGVASARAAGLRIIGVPSFADEELDVDRQVSSLRDQQLAAWIATWN